MIQKILTTLTIVLLAYLPQAFADELDIDYDENISSGTEFSLNLSEIEIELEEEYQTDIFFEWDIQGASTKRGSEFARTFESPGEKEINLTVYRNIDNQKSLIYSQAISLFIYSSSIPFLYDSDINSEAKSNFDKIARNSGVYIYDLGSYSETNIKGSQIMESLSQYDEILGEKSDYIGVWGGKDFILNSAGQVNKQAGSNGYGRSINFAIFSSFNIDILESFVENFLSEKSNIESIVISNEAARFQAIEKPLSIQDFIQHLSNNNHDYKKATTSNRIQSMFFISKFVSNLSNAGFYANSIYLIIIIPILLLGLSVMKHIIGFSPLGIMVPVGITLLFFEVGLIVTSIILCSLVLINLILAKLISNYTLLYTPKASLLIGINIVFIIAVINVLFQYNLIGGHVESIIFIILFVLISERLITLIIGKEFREYKFSLLYTFAFALISYIIFQFDTIQIFILAYPEMILVLIPINFWIGRFTGLRITEYFRFREVIHNVEEEE